jgi:hypothetical protein
MQAVFVIEACTTFGESASAADAELLLALRQMEQHQPGATDSDQHCYAFSGRQSGQHRPGPNLTLGHPDRCLG